MSIALVELFEIIECDRRIDAEIGKGPFNHVGTEP